MTFNIKNIVPTFHASTFLHSKTFALRWKDSSVVTWDREKRVKRSGGKDVAVFPKWEKKKVICQSEEGNRNTLKRVIDHWLVIALEWSSGSYLLLWNVKLPLTPLRLFYNHRNYGVSEVPRDAKLTKHSINISLCNKEYSVHISYVKIEQSFKKAEVSNIFKIKDFNQSHNVSIATWWRVSV